LGGWNGCHRSTRLKGDVKEMIKLILSCAVCLAIVAAASNCTASEFATELVSYSGPFGAAPYDDPYAVLGKPAKYIKASPTQIFSCSLVYPAFLKDPNGVKLVVTLDTGSYIVVGFDHKVADDPGNPYGIDFIVFGNSKLVGDGWIEPNTDMDSYYLKTPAYDEIMGEPVTVSVAQHPDGPWYTFENGPFADASFFPTNAFAWDSDVKNWGREQDWLKAVDPNLTTEDFNGLSAAQAIELYEGSAGGTGFDLKWLAPADYEVLETDPATGRKWIRYIKVTSDDAGEIDGFADVAACPSGDLNRDYRVNVRDFAVAAHSGINMALLEEVINNWLECSRNCQ
jgi:hypothetical protein